jgi:tRNA(Arg) A34 adenosine deaminase TadA
MRMSDHVYNRRFLTRSLTLAPLFAMFRPTSLRAQSSITQPDEKTKAGYLARARALRDQAAREGDQAYGAVVVRQGTIVGEGRNYVVLESDPTAHAELLAVRDACRRLKTRDLSDCEVFSTATPCPMCQGALYWARVSRFHTASTPEVGLAPKLAC